MNDGHSNKIINNIALRTGGRALVGLLTVIAHYWDSVAITEAS